MIVVDTSGLLAYLDDRDAAYEQASTVLADEQGDLLLSPFVLAELDYLLAKHVGARAALELLRDVADAAYDLVTFDQAGVRAALDVLERFADLGITLTDASIVVLAERYGTRRILTLDRRRFSALRTRGGEPFELLP